MMIGTMMSNFWGALVAFSIYFLFMFQKPESPFNILFGSFIFALVGFVIMFLLRFLIGYILYTPEETTKETEESGMHPIEDELQLTDRQKPTSTRVSESSEEIAQVVKTMMNS